MKKHGLGKLLATLFLCLIVGLVCITFKVVGMGSSLLREATVLTCTLQGCQDFRDTLVDDVVVIDGQSYLQVEDVLQVQIDTMVNLKNSMVLGLSDLDAVYALTMVVMLVLGVIAGIPLRTLFTRVNEDTKTNTGASQESPLEISQESVAGRIITHIGNPEDTRYVTVNIEEHLCRTVCVRVPEGCEDSMVFAERVAVKAYKDREIILTSDDYNGTTLVQLEDQEGHCTDWNEI